MNNYTKIGKCQSCGDYTETLSYNKTYSCKVCLSMDRNGISRENIIDRILEKRKNYGRPKDKLRRVRGKNWKIN